MFSGDKKNSIKQALISLLGNLLMEKEYKGIFQQIDFKSCWNFPEIPKMNTKQASTAACYGISVVNSSLFLEDKKKFHHLIEIFKYIGKMRDAIKKGNIEELYKKIRIAREHLKNSIALSEEEKILIDIPALIETIRITHDPDEFQHILGAQRERIQDFSTSVEFMSFSGKENEEKMDIGIKKVGDFLQCHDEKTLSDMLKLIATHTSGIENGISFVVGGKSHAISVFFSAKSGWGVCNPNDLPGKTFASDDTSNVASEIFSSLKNYNKEKLAYFNFSMLSRAADFQRIHEIIKEIKTTETWKSARKRFDEMDEAEKKWIFNRALLHYDLELAKILIESSQNLIVKSSEDSNFLISLIDAGGNLNDFEFMLEKGINPKKVDAIFAAEYNRSDILDLFEKHGLKTDIDALNAACKRGHLSLAKFLAKKGILPDNSTFRAAIDNNCVEIASFLLDDYSSFATKEMLSLAIQRGNHQIAQMINEKGNLGYSSDFLKSEIETERKKILFNNIQDLVISGEVEKIKALLTIAAKSDPESSEIFRSIISELELKYLEDELDNIRDLEKKLIKKRNNRVDAIQLDQPPKDTTILMFSNMKLDFDALKSEFMKTPNSSDVVAFREFLKNKIVEKREAHEGQIEEKLRRLAEMQSPHELYDLYSNRLNEINKMLPNVEAIMSDLKKSPAYVTSRIASWIENSVHDEVKLEYGSLSPVMIENLVTHIERSLEQKLQDSAESIKLMNEYNKFVETFGDHLSPLTPWDLELAGIDMKDVDMAQKTLREFEWYGRNARHLQNILLGDAHKGTPFTPVIEKALNRLVPQWRNEIPAGCQSIPDPDRSEMLVALQKSHDELSVLKTQTEEEISKINPSYSDEKAQTQIEEFHEKQVNDYFHIGAHPDREVFIPLESCDLPGLDVLPMLQEMHRIATNETFDLFADNCSETTLKIVAAGTAYNPTLHECVKPRVFGRFATPQLVFANVLRLLSSIEADSHPVEPDPSRKHDPDPPESEHKLHY